MASGGRSVRGEVWGGQEEEGLETKHVAKGNEGRGDMHMPCNLWRRQVGTALSSSEAWQGPQCQQSPLA